MLDPIGHSIGFGALADDVDTKALVVTDDDLQAQGIGAFGQYVYDGHDIPVFQNTPVTYNSDARVWQSDPLKYWIDFQDYTFALVSPYTTSGIGSGAVSFNYHDGTYSVYCTESNKLTYQSKDLLVGAKDRFLSGAPGVFTPVEVNLVHAFAALEFRVINASDQEVYRIYNPRLTGIINEGRLDVSLVQQTPSLSWTLGTTAIAEGNNSYYQERTVNNLAISSTNYADLYDPSTIVVLPQTIANKPVMFTFTYQLTKNNETTIYPVSFNLGSAIYPVRAWESGKKYTYTATITSNYITFNVEVRDWRQDVDKDGNDKEYELE